MTRPTNQDREQLFSGALATHAGDALYEYCHIPEFATAVRHLRRYDGDIWRWWQDFNSRMPFTREEGPVAARGTRRGGVLLRERGR